MTKAEKFKQIRLTAESCEQRDIPSIFKDKLGDMMGGGGGGKYCNFWGGKRGKNFFKIFF
jgi:hypothetical protein